LKHFASIILLASSIAEPTAQATILFELLPADGFVHALPGASAGWGYSVRNQDLTQWLALIALTPDAIPASSLRTVFDFPVLAPGQHLIVPFDGTSGLLELSWLPEATPGSVFTGNIRVEGEWYPSNPYLSPFPVPTSGEFIDIGFSAAVLSVSAVPEPAAVFLFAFAAIVLTLCRFRSTIS